MRESRLSRERERERKREGVEGASRGWGEEEGGRGVDGSYETSGRLVGS